MSDFQGLLHGTVGKGKTAKKKEGGKGGREEGMGGHRLNLKTFPLD